MELSREDFDKLFEVFRAECDEHIQKLNSALVSLEARPDQTELIEEIFREAHSLKGAARMMNFTAIEAISHHLETILGRVKNNEVILSADINGLILKGLDAVEAIVQTISELGEEGAQDATDILRELERVSGGQGQRPDKGELDAAPKTKTKVTKVESKPVSPHQEKRKRDGGLSQEEFGKLFEIFKVESDEHIQKLNAALIALEESPDQTELIEEIFREAHSLKGAARMMNFSAIESISHYLETILGKIKNNEVSLSADINDLILKGLDAVGSIIQTISEGGREDTGAYTSLLNELENVSREGHRATELDPLEAPGQTQTNIEGRSSAGVGMDLGLFSQETREAHRKLVENLLEIERSPNDLSKIKIAYEQAYALKGSARIVKHDAMGDLAFSMEKILRAVLDKRLVLTQPMTHALLEGSEFIRKFIDQVEEGDEKSVPSDLAKAISALNAFIEPDGRSEAERTLPDLGESPAENTIRENELKPKTPRVLKPPRQHKKSTEKPKSTVRVSSEKLDRLMDQAGEFLIMKLKARQRLIDIQMLIHDYNNATRDMKGKIAYLNKVNLRENGLADHKAKPEKSQALDLGSMTNISDRLGSLHKSLYDDFRQFSIIIERLQDDVKKTRLFPFQTVLDTFPRMVRDLSASFHKKVRLETSGVHIELDKYILEEIKDPLMHIIRNSIDHGIEMPEERIQLGKPEVGLITVDIAHKGSNGVIRVKDDGKGIHIEKIKHTAIKKKIYTEKELEKMNEKQIVHLIFHPGFSTSEIITDISGRGVGMDVVKSNIEKLNGTIMIDSKPSEGTTFTMVIPLTLSTTQSLKISVCGGTYFLPVNMVERIVKVVEKDLAQVGGFPAVHYAGSYIPYVRLEKILEVGSSESNPTHERERPVAILRSGKSLAAFGMDHFMGEEEILMKSLGQYMKRVRNISGVTIMRDGTIAPVLNVTDLINTVQLSGLAHSKLNREKIEDKTVLSILVVDDSVMTRTLEKNILESYGYLVSTAFDGQDALAKLQEAEFDIIVSDVQMPNLNGLELTRQVKQDSRYKDIPVILVTALESDEDKKRGIEVGADAYIVKSSFDQSNLLSTIQKLA